MSATGQIATTFSAGGNQSMNGYDNETGTTSITIPLESFPANSVNAPFTLALTAANIQQVFLCATTNCTITTNNTNTADVQTFSITGTPTGGSFPIAWTNSNGSVLVTTAPYNSNSATLQTALQLLTGASNVTCSGGPLPGTPVNATFAGALNTGKQPVFVASNSGLTGGTTPAVSVAHTVVGAPTDTINLVAGIPRVWGASQGYGSSPFSGNVNGAFMTCNASTLLNIGIIT